MDDIERILSAPDDLEPSSGFLAAVLSATRQEAAAPPLHFPWRRFAVGMAACLVMATAGTALIAQAGGTIVRATGLGPLATALPELGYAGLAVLGSLALARLPRLFVRRSSS